MKAQARKRGSQVIRARRGRAGEEGGAQVEQFRIYAHPSDAGAQSAADCLLEVIRLHGMPGDSGPDQVQDLEAGCPGRGCSIYFGPGHRVELLLDGEAVGKGLVSELPKVLLDQCSPKGGACLFMRPLDT